MLLIPVVPDAFRFSILDGLYIHQPNGILVRAYNITRFDLFHSRLVFFYIGQIKTQSGCLLYISTKKLGRPVDPAAPAHCVMTFVYSEVTGVLMVTSTVRV